MASVEHQPPAVLGGGRRAEVGGGDEAGHVGAGSRLAGIGEEAERRGRAVELAEPAAEAGSGDEAAPGLTDERGADEASGIGRREAEKELLDEILRHHHAALPGGPHPRAAGKARVWWFGWGGIEREGCPARWGLVVREAGDWATGPTSQMSKIHLSSNSYQHITK